MNKSPAYQRYSKDYLSSVRVQMMTLTEEGAYNRLLEYCWINGSIPSDPNQAARLVGKGCSAEIAKVCLEMFTPHPTEPGKMVHDRLEVERIKQQDHSEKRKKASEARWNKESEYTDARGKQAKSKSDANAMQMDMQNDALHIASSSSIAKKDKPNGLSKKPATKSLPDDFELTAEMKAWAAKNCPRISVAVETENFKDKNLANGAAYVDWLAAWRTWMRNAEKWVKDAPPKPPEIVTFQNTSFRDRNAEMEALGFPKIPYSSEVTQ